MENAEKRAAEGMSADSEEEEQVLIRSREAIRVAAKIAWQKREEEEARALVIYSQNVKKIAEAKRVRAINKGRALEQAEREAAYAARQGSVPPPLPTSQSDADGAEIYSRTVMMITIDGPRFFLHILKYQSIHLHPLTVSLL